MSGYIRYINGNTKTHNSMSEKSVEFCVTNISSHIDNIFGVFYLTCNSSPRTITTSKESSEIGRIVDIDGNFVFSSGIAFVATYQGDVAALDTRSGRFIWKEKTSTANDLLSSRGKIILIDEKDQVLAYSQNSGNLEWFNKDFFLRELTSPNRLKSLIVYGDFKGFLHALDISQGEQVARKKVSRSKIVSISTKDGNVLTLDSKGKLSLFTLQ